MEQKSNERTDLVEELKKRESFLNTEEVMTLLRIQRGTLCEWVRTGQIPAFRAGHGYLFDPRLLADWLSERMTATLPLRRVT